MRKQESVHLHALLVAVADHLGERPGAPSPDTSAYVDLGVGPSGVHHSKADHEEAILVLAAAIDGSLQEHAAPGAP
jgi:hypothetical protein